MCGLVAVLSKQKFGIGFKETTVFRQMLFADVLRGADATGLFGVNKHGNLKMVKAAVPSTVFIGRETAKELLDNKHNNLIALVGHNRAATKGASDKDEFAHPFIEGDVCLVHNGTLNAHKHLADTIVDSHAICHAINDLGYKKALPEVDGAFALIWYEAKTKEIRFTRNYQRPLFIVETSSALYLASEIEMVEWILSRNNEKIIESKSVETTKVYSFNIETQKLSVDNFPTNKQTQKQHTPPVYTKQPMFPTIYNQPKKHGSTGGGQYNPNLGWKATYSTGEKIPFELLTVEVQEKDWKATGRTLDGEMVTATVTDGIALHLLELLDNCIVQCEANVSVVYMSNKGGKESYRYITNQLEVTETTLLTTIPQTSNETIFISENNIKVKQNDLIDQGGCCTQCGGYIDVDTDEDIQWAHVKYKRGKIKTLICGDCLDTFRESIPNYGKGRRYANKTNRNHSVSTGQSISESTEELTSVESIRASISC